MYKKIQILIYISDFCDYSELCKVTVMKGIIRCREDCVSTQWSSDSDEGPAGVLPPLATEEAAHLLYKLLKTSTVRCSG